MAIQSDPIVRRIAGTEEDRSSGAAFTQGRLVEALRERERELLEAQRIARLGTWHLDCTTGRMTWSEQLYRIFGLSPTAPPPDFAEQARLFLPSSYERWLAANEGLLKTGETYTLDLECGLASGSTAWVCVCGELERRTEASILAVRGTVQEITERKQLEEKLQHSEERMRLGMRVASLALAEIDYATDTSHLSEEAARLFGLADRAVTVPRKAVHDVFHPADREELNRRIASCLDPDGSGWFAMDHRIVLPDGSTRWIRVRKQVTFSEMEGKRRPRHGMLAAYDVTLEKDASEVLRASEQRFRELAESLPQFVWTANVAGKKTYCNPRYLTYTGCSSEEELESVWLARVHPDDRDVTRRAWAEAVATGASYHREYRLACHDGTYRHFMARAHAVRNASGDIERWLGSSTDVHERKLAEEALRRSEKLAVAGRLAASVAHEINNPLAGVTNLLYLLANHGSLDRTALDYVRTAQDELSRVSEIATNTLRFHKQASAPAPARVAEIVDSVLALFKARLRSARLELLRDYRRTEPLTCRSGEVRQAVANIVANAIEATPPGGRLRVRLRTGREWKGRESFGIRITIADTGAGIEPSRRLSIFEPFSSTKGITGTGLGLWITQDLMRNHGGSISLRSSIKPGASGTVFALFFPFEPTPANTAGHESPSC